MQEGDKVRWSIDLSLLLSALISGMLEKSLSFVIEGQHIQRALNANLEVAVHNLNFRIC